MIPAAELARLAHRLGVGDRVIEKDYVLSWLLVAIAESELGNALAFKGGTALKRCYYPHYRFSEDLDFSLTSELSHTDLITAFEALYPWLDRRVNLALALRGAEQSMAGSTTLLINYVGPLSARPGSRHLKVDLTRGELLLYPAAGRALLAPYTDYPVGTLAPTYALEEILIEKLCAVMGRTEPRDLYDVYWLFESGDVDLHSVPDGFALKCRHKGLDPGRLEESLTGKLPVIGRLWASRLALQVPDLIDLDEVLRSVRRHLRGQGLV